MTNVVQKILEEADKSKKGRKKRVAKVGPSEQAQTPKKKVKRVACKPRSPTPSDHEDSQSNTISDIQVQDNVHHEQFDIGATSHPLSFGACNNKPEGNFSNANICVNLI